MDITVTAAINQVAREMWSMYINDTGYPSVTDIIRPFIDSQWFTEDARNRGSFVHQAVAAYLNGVWSPPLPDVWQPYVDSAKDWIDRMIDRVLVVEQRFVDADKGFCGKPDLIATIRGDNGPTLIDWKTSASYQKWWPVQIAAYRRLARVNGHPTIRGLSVRLHDSLPIVAEASGARDYDVFVSLLNAYKYFN